MKLTRKLLSGLCVAALLISLLPVIGVSAADTLLEEKFETSSVGAEFDIGSIWYNHNIAGGGAVARTVLEQDGNRYVEMSIQNTTSSTETARNRIATRTLYSGTYTLEFDCNKASDGRFDVYLRTGGSVRVLVSPAGVPSLTVLPAAAVPGKMASVYAPVTMDPAKWYTFKITVSDEVITMDIYDKSNGYTLAGSVSLNQDNTTLPNLLDPYNIWFDMWGSDDLINTAKQTVCLDNIVITEGAYEDLLTGTVSKDSGSGSGGSQLGVVYQDDFEDFDLDERYSSKAFSASDLANGSVVTRDIKVGGGNKYLQLGAQNGASSSDTARVRLKGTDSVNGTYTVEWDYNTQGNHRFDVYLRANGAIRITVTEELNPTIRVLASAAVPGKMESAVGTTVLKTDHWYTFKASVTDESLTLEVFDKEKDNLPVETLSIVQDSTTLSTLLGDSVIWFDMWGYSDLKKTEPAVVALDNINIVRGAYEGLLNAEAEVGSVTPVTGDGLGSDIDLYDHECPSKKMLDVYINAWYHEAVDYALTNKLMNGFNAVTFGTAGTLTRAQVVQVLYNKEGQPAVSGSHGFTDVPASQWYNNAVTWGTKNKVMSGYGGGKFGPEDTVTIEQVAVILWNYAGNPAVTGNAETVGPHSGWAANALGWAVQTGLLTGMPYELVTDGATRAQTAQMLMNYLSK